MAWFWLPAWLSREAAMAAVAPVWWRTTHCRSRRRRSRSIRAPTATRRLPSPAPISTGAVTLSLGGAPAGVTGSFNPAAPTGTSSTLTVSVEAAVAPGVYNLTVDGTGTPGNRSTALTLTVSAAADYTLSLAPAALTIDQGADGNTAVTVDPHQLYGCGDAEPGRCARRGHRLVQSGGSHRD